MSLLSRRQFRIVFFLWLLQCFAYFVPGATWSPVSRMGLTRALVERHSLDVGEWAEATGDRARREGRWYSDKAPIPSILATPAYAIVRGFQRLTDQEPPAFESTPDERIHAARVTVNSSFANLLYASSVATAALAGALLGLLLLELLERRFDPATAWIGTTLVMLGTPLFAYSTSFFGHVPAAAFLLGGLVLLERQRAPASHRAAGAFLLACAVGCEYLAALPAATIGLWAWLREADEGRARRLGCMVAGAAPIVLALATYHLLCFGAPWTTGYSFVVDPTFAAGHEQGWMGIRPPRGEALWGLFLGERRGLLYISPITVVAIPGLLLYFHRRRDGATAALAMGALLLIGANAGYYMWWGGAATGPRHLVPILPLLAIGLAEIWRRRRLRWLVLLAAAPSIANMLALTSVGLDAPESGDVLLDYAWRHLTRGDLARASGSSNFGIRLGLPVAGSLGPLLVWMLVGARWLWTSRRASQGMFDIGASIDASGMLRSGSDEPEQAM